MRRFTLAISAVLSTAAIASFVLLLAGSGTGSQARAAESQDTPLEGTSFGDPSVSQGSLSGAEAPPEVIEAMEAPDYSQVVDNASSERFDAPGWQTDASLQDYYGTDYSVNATEITEAARFKVTIPADDYYSVYAWWPAGGGNSTAARIGVSTVSGIEWVTVNQQREGGDWIKIGDFQLEAGDDYVVQISADGGTGAVVADAVAVVRGAYASPPYGEQASGEQLYSASGNRRDGINGRDVVRSARKHIGTRYRNSPPHPCLSFRKEDCSCHTRVVFKRFDRHLPDNPVRQWKKGTRVSKSNLRKGDLVFFDENRNGKLQPWDHVGIYSGGGWIVHASGYFNKVVESRMKYIRGYWGAKRIRPH